MELSQRTWDGTNQWLLFQVMTEPPNPGGMHLAWMEWISAPRSATS
jgi:hypothetical protein